MGRYKYSKEEQETLKVLKMQEEQLKRLENGIQSDLQNGQEDAAVLADLRRRAEALLKNRGLTPPSFSSKSPEIDPIKVDKADMPSWEELVNKANSKVQGEVTFEDLLSKDEFQFCIDEVQRINDEFSKKTNIANKVDMSFLMIATALQTARWILIQLIMGDLGETINSEERISNKEADRIKAKDVDDWNQKHSENDNISSGKGYPTWKDIIFGQYKRIDGLGKSSGRCPYDAQAKGPKGFDDGGRGNHRLNTLGHDPILGWIFGTANIMTCTISLSKKFAFNTYRVTYPGACFGEQIPMDLMFQEMYESFREDKFRLAAALFAQYAHLKSDIFTPNGLPVPLVETFTEELAGKLYTEQYDALCLLKDIKKVGIQAVLAGLINMIIGFVHGLLYNPKKDGPRELYEVRTRKILSISNSLASAGNIAYVIGTEDWGKLDVGGILVSLHRLFTDVRFIARIKKNFIENEMDKVLERELKELDSYFV